MSGSDAEIVLRYYVQIGQMLQFVRREQAEMELNYNTIRGTGLDGMPKGSGTGDVVGRTATKLAEDGVAEQIQALQIRQVVLCQDSEDVAQALQAIAGVYSCVLIFHYRDRHKWSEVARMMRYSEATFCGCAARHWRCWANSWRQYPWRVSCSRGRVTRALKEKPKKAPAETGE